MRPKVVCAIELEKRQSILCAEKTAPKRGRRGVSFLAVLAFFTLIGCSPAVHETNFGLRYPSFPEEPRFAYIKSYYGAGDEVYLDFVEKLIGSSKSDVFQKPTMAVSRGNTLYVAVLGEKSIAVIDMVTNKISMISSLRTNEAYYPIQFLAGLAVSAEENIYICDPVARVVYMADKTGVLKKMIGHNILKDPYGIALDEQNARMYVSDRRDHAVHVFSLTGDFLSTIGKPGKNDGEFQLPHGVAVDRRNGNLLVGDTENFRIQVFNSAGVFLRKWGEAGDSVQNFGRIASLAVDSEGHVYVSDLYKHKVIIFDEEGRILMDLGSPGRNIGFFQLPMGISIDVQDRLYVADSLNGRVQVFQYLSDAWKKDHPEEYKKYQEKPPEKPVVIKKRKSEVKLTH